jgi:GTP-binding protein
VDFRHRREYKAEKGQSGSGRNMTGRSGADISIRVPLGTIVIDQELGEKLGDVTEHGQRLRVAAGGRGGLGNEHFKSSTNRAPRKTTQGTQGEERTLHLELKVLADVGLLGFPNAGKSTLISAVSAARPKVADYPFTTLYPNLGVVSVGVDSSFVIADVPGLIEGAAGGAGLGIQFLKHLQRTRLLLHLVDIAPLDESQNPLEEIRQLEIELAEFDADLLSRPRWLAFTKADLLEPEEARDRAEKIVGDLGWKSPWALISSVTHSGTMELMQQIMLALDEMAEIEAMQSSLEEVEEFDMPETPPEP